MSSCLLSQIIDEWVSDIGDTTFWGWLITFMYVACVAGSYYYVQNLKRADHRPKVLLWRCIFVLVLLLGINKQLDFQTLLYAAGRAVANVQGWYEQRRLVQACFAKIVVILLFVSCVVVLFRTRTVLLKSALELLGTGVLIVFTLIRTSSLGNLHKAEELRFDRIPHIHAFELLGLLLILAAIGLGLKKQRQQGHRT